MTDKTYMDWGGVARILQSEGRVARSIWNEKQLYAVSHRDSWKLKVVCEGEGISRFFLTAEDTFAEDWFVIPPEEWVDIHDMW